MGIDDRTRAEIEQALGRRLDRRDFLRIAALGGTAAGHGRAHRRLQFGQRIAVDGRVGRGAVRRRHRPRPLWRHRRSRPRASPAGRAIKIGFVSPQTGPLAGFGEADKFVFRTA